jgi:hypothetical protein
MIASETRPDGTAPKSVFAEAMENTPAPEALMKSLRFIFRDLLHILA